MDIFYVKTDGLGTIADLTILLHHRDDITEYQATIT